MTRSIPYALAAPRALVAPCVLAVLCLISLALAGCGKVGELTPQSGNVMPSRAYGQSEEQSATALITPSVQSRPGRSDELLTRSKSRSDDQFDLPPGSVVTPVTQTDTEKTSSPNQPASPQNGSKPQ